MKPESIAKAARGARVLLVEDHPVNQRVVVSLLARAGLEVTVVSSGAEAVPLALGGRYALVLMDLRLPDMTGFEAARQIRAVDRDRCVPLIAVSADADAATREAGRRAGLDDHLAKPFEPRQLYAAVGRWLGVAAELDATAATVASSARIEPAALPPVPVEAPGVDPATLARGRSFGIDLAQGLRLFGDWPTYRTVLGSFAEIHRAGLPEAATMLPGAAAPMEALHALAGACSAIGAATLAADAGRLERAWHTLDTVSRVRELLHVEQTVAALAADLRDELRRPPPRPPPVVPPA